MAVSEETVKRLCGLARLSPGEGEMGRLTAELGRILEEFGRLEAVPAEPVRPVAGGLDTLRPDLPAPSLPPEDVLRNAPMTDGPYVLVPRAVEVAP